VVATVPWSGPAQKASKYGASGGVGANLHTPASPSRGRVTAGKFARQHHPAGQRTLSVIGGAEVGLVEAAEDPCCAAVIGFAVHAAEPGLYIRHAVYARTGLDVRELGFDNHPVLTG
jgi:hypothetical protein